MVSMSKIQVGDQDWISELPDALLCHILSFLPTTWAVRTTVLSKRWNNVWTCVPNLDFDITDFWAYYITYRNFDRFEMFVERVLGFRDSSSDIKKFSLQAHVFDNFARIEGWICTAVRCNVVELYLDLWFEFSDDNQNDVVVVLPRSLFTCKTLRVLKMLGLSCIDFVDYAPDPASGFFPSLKTLHVRVDNPGKGLMEKLFTNCPVLEHLIIEADVADDVDYKIQVSAPELKTLRISLWDQNFMNSVCIDAPKLESLVAETVAVSNFSLDARSLVNADISLWEDDFAVDRASFAKFARAILAKISNVKYLSLSATHLEAGYLPFFLNLNQLKVSLRRCNYWKFLAVLLEKAPYLEDLVLYEFGMRKPRTKDSELPWDPPKVVPNCLSSHLKTICIPEFNGWKVEMEVAKYLLKNGHLLDKMTIYTGYYECTEDVEKELLMFQRASATCQVVFKR